MKKILCEVYSRVVGYFRPVQCWNLGKREEFKDRREYDAMKSLKNDIAREIGENRVVKP
jgi:hypothetical protein